MKFISTVIATFLLLMVSNSICAQDSTSVDSLVPNTLVAYYPFSGDAKDQSGFENDGQVFGATLTKDRFENPNSAFLFDGENDFIRVSDADNLTPTNYSWSISVWFKTQYPGDRFLLYKGSNTNNREYASGVRLDSLGSFQINENGSHTNNDGVLTSTVVEKNVWHHLVGVWDSSTVKIYFNNKLEQIDSTDLVVGNFSSDLFIGTYGGATSQYAFNGKIDDLRLYNSALDSTSIDKLFHEGGWPLPQDSVVIPKDTLVAYYPFSGDAKDQSGFENDGQVFGATLTKDRFENPNSAFLFDGENDFIRVNDADNLTPTNYRWSISVWFKTQYPGDRFLLYKGSNTNNREYASGVRLDSLGSFQINENGSHTNNDGVLTSTVVEKNVWHHLVGVWDSSTVKIYFNNKLEQIDSTDLVVGNFSSDLFIGTYGGATSQYAFNGKIDDLRLYNSALDSTSIDKLFHEGGWPLPQDSVIVPNDTLAAYYPFNGDAKDQSGFENDGQVFGAELTNDRFGELGFAYQFDGIDDYMKIESPEAFHTNKNLSFSFWAKGTSPDSSFKGLITKTNMDPFGIAIDNGDRLLFTVNNDEIPLNLIVEGLLTNPNDWYQYVAVFKAGEYLRLFRDGIEVGTLYGTIPSNMNVNSENIYIGATKIEYSTTTDTLFFEGALDEIRFYNYDLTPDQVLSIYNQENELPVSNESIKNLPKEYSLYQNYPNPFNPSTTIKFDLPEKNKVSLKVYDITGRLVATLVEGVRNAGEHQVTFNASQLASGVYIYELRTSEYSTVKKFTLIK